jgi:hypothetical protein
LRLDRRRRHRPDRPAQRGAHGIRIAAIATRILQVMTSGIQAGYNFSMGPFVWNHAKNALLMAERGLCFEANVAAVEADGLLDGLEQPNPSRYPSQGIRVVGLNADAYLVPCVETDSGLFLKTIIPSRKATRQYLADS